MKSMREMNSMTGLTYDRYNSLINEFYFSGFTDIEFRYRNVTYISGIDYVRTANS